MVNLSTLHIFSSQIEHDFDAIDYPDYNWDEETEKKSPISSLPDTASKLLSLRSLNLSNTEITILPEFLADLPALRFIQIIDCNIETIPPAVQQLVDKGELTIIKTEEEMRMQMYFHERRKPRRR